MKEVSLITVFAILLSVVSPGFAEERRTWTSTDGSAVEAEFVSATENEVTIRRVLDGRRFTFSLERLSDADREWISNRADGEGSVALLPGDVSELTQIPEDPDGMIRLPLRVHVISGIELERGRTRMSTWITPEDIQGSVLAEINRIWKPAGIEWAIESIMEQPAVEVPNREEAITYIQNAKRDAAGKSDPKRMPLIHAFCDKDNRHPAMHNLYFFPYLGQTSQGNASMGGNFAVVGVWTDKPSRGLRPPEKFALKEEGPFKIGSIGRTCSHELGHNLGLGHPDPAKQTQFGLLMGGKNSGYDLTAEEIALARETAVGRAEKVLQWAASNGEAEEQSR